MLAKTFGSSVFGVSASLITIETNVGQGTKCFLVGLPDSTIKESILRVESSLKQLGFFFPRRKVIINLAPADIRKEGSAYDLPIALSILHASEQISFPDLDRYVIMGELGLNGDLRPIKGALPMVLEAKKQGIFKIILPKQNAKEAAIVSEVEVSQRANMRRSIVSKRGIKAGEVIELADLDFKRPGDGYSPADIKVVVGKKAVLDIEPDEVIYPAMIQ